MYSDASNINIHVGATEIARIRSTRLTGQEVCYIACRHLAELVTCILIAAPLNRARLSKGLHGQRARDWGITINIVFDKLNSNLPSTRGLSYLYLGLLGWGWASAGLPLTRLQPRTCFSAGYGCLSC